MPRINVHETKPKSSTFTARPKEAPRSPTRPRLTVHTPFTADTPAQRVRLRLMRSIFHNPANNWGVYHFTPVYDPSDDTFVRDLCNRKSRYHEHNRVECSITGTGIIYFPRINNIYELEGREIEDPKYGKQLQFRSSKRLDESAAKSSNKNKDISELMNSQSVDSNAEAKKFLRTKYKASFIKELTTLVGGADKLHEVITERTIPEALIASDKAAELAREYHIFRNFETVSATLNDMGIGQAFHSRIIDEWGPDCIDRIAKNPYTLMEIPGFGFKRIDAIVMSKDPNRKHKFKIDKDSPLRIGAAYSAVLENESRQGHTWTPLNVLIPKTKNLLGIRAHSEKSFPSPRNEEYIQLFHCEDMGSRVRVYNRKTYLAESRVCSEIGDAISEIEERQLSPEMHRTYEITNAASILNKDQKEAFVQAAFYSLSIITGGPGTGKTFLIKSIVDHHGVDECAILAPTGKAAVRITQATGFNASTIHKYLGINMGGGQRNMNEKEKEKEKEILGPKGAGDSQQNKSSHPFSVSSTYEYPDNPAPHSVFVIDEFSMVDVELFAKFLSAIRPIPRSKIILIGDPDQLPSIGPGNVLHDLIDLREDGIPVTVLREPVRTSRENLIYKNAEYIRDIAHKSSKAGIPMLLSNDDPDSEFLWDKLSDPQDMVSHVVGVVKEYYDTATATAPANGDSQRTVVDSQEDDSNHGMDVLDMDDHARTHIHAHDTDPMQFEPLPQVIIPTNQGAVSVESSNKLLQAILNPHGQRVPGTTLRLGDKVMCTQNNYEVDMMNGDVGTIYGYEVPEDDPESAPELLVKFFNYGFEHKIPQKLFNKLTLAYAITIHKSQGSEYNEVVVMLHKQHSLMLYRNLIYTAITRAKKHLRLVGSTQAVQSAMRTSIPQRRTAMTRKDIFRLK